MITSVTELLSEFLARQAELLGEQTITHAPTIGEMYEGLTRDVVSRAIPPSLGLKIVNGFIEGVDGTIGQEVDAMLVMGDKGVSIPHTQKYRWPIKDVLAVFEVKKNLYQADLIDSLHKMKGVWDQQKALYHANTLGALSVVPSHRAFARLTGRYPHKDEINDLTSPSAEYFRTLVGEQLAPVRIIFGYEGYVDEVGLREQLCKQVEASIGVAGHSPLTLPNLVICRQNSILKMSGHPYIVPMRGDSWVLFASERKNPLRLMIELIWTRISNQFKAVLPMDDTLEMEALAPLLSVRSMVQDGQRAWVYNSFTLTADEIAKIPEERWSPTEISTAENAIIMSANNDGGLDIRDPDYIDFAQSNNFQPKALAEGLVEKRLFVWTGEYTAVPIADTTHVVFTPDGRMWAAVNSDLLTLWFEKLIKA